MLKKFQCNKCCKEFDKKYSYDRHLSSKKGCDDINVETLIVTEADKSFECEYCEKKYEKPDNLKRHLENEKSKCYIKRHPDEHQINNQKTVNKIIQKNYNSVNATFNNINNNNITNNIAITPIINQFVFAPHGKETISHITKEIMLELLNKQSFTEMCTDLMRLLYFNVKVPENQNWTLVYPKNKKGGLEFNLETQQFERKMTHDIIDDKFTNMIDLLLPLIEEIQIEDREHNILNAQQRRNIYRYTAHYGMVEISKDSKNVYNAIHAMAYEERRKSMDTWRENGFKGNHLSLKF